GSDEARRDLAGVLALAVAVASAGERADVSVGEFLRSIDAGDEGPGTAVPPRGRHLGAVRVLTAHGSAGLEFDTVVVVGAQEGSFPSLARNEPMFDLAALMALHADPGAWWFQRDWTRSDRPPRDELRVSYSKLDTLENCALQFVLSEELGLEGAAGYHAWVGHLVHGLIEECERGDIE